MGREGIGGVGAAGDGFGHRFSDGFDRFGAGGKLSGLGAVGGALGFRSGLGLRGRGVGLLRGGDGVGRAGILVGGRGCWCRLAVGSRGGLWLRLRLVLLRLRLLLRVILLRLRLGLLRLRLGLLGLRLILLGLRLLGWGVGGGLLWRIRPLCGGRRWGCLGEWCLDGLAASRAWAYDASQANGDSQASTACWTAKRHGGGHHFLRG